MPRTRQCRAHPRSRGENVIVSVLADTKRGSSPLTRGKRHEVRGQGCAAGLIPAHAGKTGRWRSRSGVWTAHPRSRGENPTSCPPTITDAGSSPLTRGKRGRSGTRRPEHRLIPAHAGKTENRLDVLRHDQWLIPAHAGKTGVLAKSQTYKAAHPRSRGENPTLLSLRKR